MSAANDIISPADIPVSGRDSYDIEDKQRVIPAAVSQLKADLGRPVDSQSDLEGFASAAYASYILASGAIKPSDPRYGDAIDDGRRADSYSNQFLDMYDRALTAIQASDSDRDGEPDSGLPLHVDTF